MYKSGSYYIGEIEVLTIGKEAGPRIEVIPAKGGVVNQIYLGENAIPILAQFENETDIDTNTAYKQTILFPFPNRLRDGVYAVNNSNYSFPINEPERNNALHGFVYDKQFTINEIDLTNEKGSIELSYIYHGQNESYPFPFTLRVRYSIGNEGFAMSASVENTGYDKLPYGFGWHPYFKTDAIAKFKSKMANLQMVNERMLPTGDETLHNFGDRLLEVTEKFDTAFRVADNAIVEIELGEFYGKTITITSDDSFRFFQLYNPKPDLIAVEPVICNINALNSGDELIELPKGETREHQIQVTLN